MALALGWKGPAAASATAHPCSVRLRSAARRSPGCRAAAVSATTQQQAATPVQRQQALKDPAKISGSSRHAVAVQDRGGPLALDTYMRLPTEQYNELDPSLILPLGKGAFLLKVPRVQLFDVWLEPEVTVHVRQQEGPFGLVFEAQECRLKGSELLQRLGLDKRFVLHFRTAVSWQPRPSAGSRGHYGGGSRAAAAVAAAAAAPTPLSNGGSVRQGQISAEAEVVVWTEVVGPFQAIPRPMLQATGNAVLEALTRALLPVFMRKLADDYQRWASSPQYRARRAAAAAHAPRSTANSP
ncbi:hypothetical protein ABPG77_002188 [Micractinium sp. CCAP 211/92]